METAAHEQEIFHITAGNPFPLVRLPSDPKDAYAFQESAHVLRSS